MGRRRSRKRRRTSEENSVNISPFAIQAQQAQKNLSNPISSSSMEKQLQRAKESSFNFANIAISRPSAHSGVTTPIQSKLEIGTVGDKYEQQADQVADRVVESINKPVNSSPNNNPIIQNKQQPNSDKPTSDSLTQAQTSRSHNSNSPVQMSSDNSFNPVGVNSTSLAIPIPITGENPERQPLSSKIDQVQRSHINVGASSPNNPSSTGAGETKVTLGFETQLNRAKSGGRSLHPKLQTKMGQVMGADFSNVKIHTDNKSNELSQSIQAKAFTTGNHIFFKKGAYNPASEGGQKLVAHELTHVIQQKQDTVQRQVIQRTFDPLNPNETQKQGLIKLNENPDIYGEVGVQVTIEKGTPFYKPEVLIQGEAPERIKYTIPAKTSVIAHHLGNKSSQDLLGGTSYVWAKIPEDVMYDLNIYQNLKQQKADLEANRPNLSSRIGNNLTGQNPDQTEQDYQNKTQEKKKLKKELSPQEINFNRETEEKYRSESIMGIVKKKKVKGKLGVQIRQREIGNDVSIWEGKDTPDPDDVGQRILGSCYFLAALKAVARQNPSFVKNMIRDNGNGTVTVDFYNDGTKESVTVLKSVTTMKKASLGVGVMAYSNCLWAELAVKAYAKWDGHEAGALPGYRGSYPGIEGGFSDIAWSHITGEPVQDRVVLSEETKAVKIEKKNWKKLGLVTKEVEQNRLKNGGVAPLNTPTGHIIPTFMDDSSVGSESYIRYKDEEGYLDLESEEAQKYLNDCPDEFLSRIQNKLSGQTLAKFMDVGKHFQNIQRPEMMKSLVHTSDFRYDDTTAIFYFLRGKELFPLISDAGINKFVEYMRSKSRKEIEAEINEYIGQFFILDIGFLRKLVEQVQLPENDVEIFLNYYKTYYESESDSNDFYYTPFLLDLYDRIKNATEDPNQYVGLGTFNYAKDNDSSTVKGLPGGHAYEVESCYDKGTKKYLVLRNPHEAGFHRKYNDSGKAQSELRGVPWYKKANRGLTTLELSDMRRYARNIYFGKAPTSQESHEVQDESPPQSQPSSSRQERNDSSSSLFGMVSESDIQGITESLKKNDIIFSQQIGINLRVSAIHQKEYIPSKGRQEESFYAVDNDSNAFKFKYTDYRSKWCLQSDRT